MSAEVATATAAGESDYIEIKKKQHPGWHNAVAGSVAGFGSRFATAPLDVSIFFRWCCLASAKRRLSHNPLFLLLSLPLCASSL